MYESTVFAIPSHILFFHIQNISNCCFANFFLFPFFPSVFLARQWYPENLSFSSIKNAFPCCRVAKFRIIYHVRAQTDAPRPPLLEFSPPEKMPRNCPSYLIWSIFTRHARNYFHEAVLFRALLTLSNSQTQWVHNFVG
jgi:hypothetical protein